MIVKKVLSEFAYRGKDDIVKRTRINQNNLWLFTVNPDSFRGRGKTPPIVTSHMTRFHMAQSEETLTQRIEKIFKAEKINESFHLPLF